MLLGPAGTGLPPSLRNIFRELHDDLGVDVPRSGDLTAWARQGVLLLNTTLTVRAGQAASHQGKGWEHFTNQVIRAVDAKPEPVVFILWGAAARRKKALIDTSRHVVIESAHPSRCRPPTASSAADRSHGPTRPWWPPATTRWTGRSRRGVRPIPLTLRASTCKEQRWRSPLG